MIMPGSRLFFISGRNKKCILWHNIRSFVCLLLRQTVGRVENISNYFDNWLVDNLKKWEAFNLGINCISLLIICHHNNLPDFGDHYLVRLGSHKEFGRPVE